MGREERSQLQATGIPPHVQVSLEVQELTKLLKKTETDNIERYDVLKSELLGAICEIRENVKQLLLSQFSINGVRSPCREDIDLLLHQNTQRCMMNEMKELLQLHQKPAAV